MHKEDIKDLLEDLDGHGLILTDDKSIDARLKALGYGDDTPDVDNLQIGAEEAVAAYLFDQTEGFEGNEEDAAEAGRGILRRLTRKLSTEEFAALKLAFGEAPTVEPNDTALSPRVREQLNGADADSGPFPVYHVAGDVTLALNVAAATPADAVQGFRDRCSALGAHGIDRIHSVLNDRNEPQHWER